MKKIFIVALVITLSGCAAGVKKTDDDIFKEASTAVSASSSQAQINMVTVDIPSHGGL